MFEYKVVQLSWDDLEITLNQLGRQGWQAISINQFRSDMKFSPVRFNIILQRPMPIPQQTMSR